MLYPQVVQWSRTDLGLLCVNPGHGGSTLRNAYKAGIKDGSISTQFIRDEDLREALVNNIELCLEYLNKGKLFKDYTELEDLLKQLGSKINKVHTKPETVLAGDI